MSKTNLKSYVYFYWVLNAFCHVDCPLNQSILFVSRVTTEEEKKLVI